MASPGTGRISYRLLRVTSYHPLVQGWLNNIATTLPKPGAPAALPLYVHCYSHGLVYLVLQS